MQSQSQKTVAWKFNPLFEQYSLQDAIKKASEMEEERAMWSQLPILSEIYAKSWKEWQGMPGADLVEDLIGWWEEDRKANLSYAWYPTPTSCELVWKGEMNKEELAEVTLRRFCNVEAAEAGGSFGVANAYLLRDRDLRELAQWWVFDEQTHQEMDKVMNLNLFPDEERLLKTAFEYTEKLSKVPVSPVTKENLKLMSRFQVQRDGPPLLIGCLMLAEIVNPWASQMAQPALKKYYGLSNETLAFVNVHTFIDYFHIRLGQYILAKYSVTKELKNLCREFFVNYFEVQNQRAKELYDELLTGKYRVKLTNDDTYLQ
jgi:hypothetical protein